MSDDRYNRYRPFREGDYVLYRGQRERVRRVITDLHRTIGVQLARQKEVAIQDVEPLHDASEDTIARYKRCNPQWKGRTTVEVRPHRGKYIPEAAAAVFRSLVPQYIRDLPRSRDGFSTWLQQNMPKPYTNLIIDGISYSTSPAPRKYFQELADLVFAIRTPSVATFINPEEPCAIVSTNSATPPIAPAITATARDTPSSPSIASETNTPTPTTKSDNVGDTPPEEPCQNEQPSNNSETTQSTCSKQPRSSTKPSPRSAGDTETADTASTKKSQTLQCSTPTAPNGSSDTDISSHENETIDERLAAD